MCHVNKIFRIAVDKIMNGSHFPSGRKGIICTAVGDIAASDAIFAQRKDPFVMLVCLYISTLFRSNWNVTKVVGGGKMRDSGNEVAA